MNVEELMTTARNSLTSRTVFAEPYERDGITVIAAAKVAGGGGGGTGQDEEGKQQGDGAGFGMSARPAGVYVVQGGKVSWQPAVDPNKIVNAVAAVVVAVLISRALNAPWRAYRSHQRHRTH